MVANYSGETILCRNIKTGWQKGTGGSNVTDNSATPVVTAAATNAMTTNTNWGSVLNLGLATGGTVTLPAAVGNGNIYVMNVTVSLTSSNTWVISCAGSDTMGGYVAIAATASGAFAATAGTSVSVTLTATTKGGLKGGQLIFTDIASGVWTVQGFLVGSGTAVTPIT